MPGRRSRPAAREFTSQKRPRGLNGKRKAQGWARQVKSRQQFLILNEFTAASIEASLKKLLAFSGA
jgi:hypothetical protein